jgi:hypothetical protein
MKMQNIPFGTTDWSKITAQEMPAQAGKALWRTQQSLGRAEGCQAFYRGLKEIRE